MFLCVWLSVCVCTLTVGIGVESRSALFTPRTLKLWFTQTTTRSVTNLRCRPNQTATTHWSWGVIQRTDREKGDIWQHQPHIHHCFQWIHEHTVSLWHLDQLFSSRHFMWSDFYITWFNVISCLNRKISCYQLFTQWCHVIRYLHHVISCDQLFESWDFMLPAVYIMISCDQMFPPCYSIWIMNVTGSI